MVGENKTEHSRQSFVLSLRQEAGEDSLSIPPEFCHFYDIVEGKKLDFQNSFSL
jgi:hypothetical protein